MDPFVSHHSSCKVLNLNLNEKNETSIFTVFDVKLNLKQAVDVVTMHFPHETTTKILPF